MSQINVPDVDDEIRKTTSGVLRIGNLDMRYSFISSLYAYHHLTVGKLVVKQRSTSRILMVVVLLLIYASDI